MGNQDSLGLPRPSWDFLGLPGKPETPRRCRGRTQDRILPETTSRPAHTGEAGITIKASGAGRVSGARAGLAELVGRVEPAGLVGLELALQV